VPHAAGSKRDEQARCVVETKLSSDEMRALVVEHAEREMVRDWEGALATMVADEPFYEMFPYRLRIAGADAIRAMWSRLIGIEEGSGAFAHTTIAPDSYKTVECVTDEMVMRAIKWDFLDATGNRQAVDHVVIFRFEGDRILSESVFNDSSTMKYFDTVFDSEFRSFPGVTLM
jgi:hypothetical protein